MTSNEIERTELEEIKKLVSRRIDIKTESLLKSTLKNPEFPQDESKSFIVIKPNDTIKNISISIDNDSLFFTKAEGFNLVLPKSFNLETDEKEVTLFLNNFPMRVFLNDRFIEISNKEDILFINILKDNEDLLKIKSGEEAYIPRVETSISYKGNGWQLSAEIHLNLENKPIKILEQFYEELNPPTYQLQEITNLLNSKVDQISLLMRECESIGYIIDGYIYKVNSYNISSGYVQLSRLIIISSDQGNKLSELDNVAMHITDLFKSNSIIFYLKDKNIIYNNLLLNNELELIDTPNIISVISKIEEINSIVYMTNQSLQQIEDDLNNVDKQSVDIHVETLSELNNTIDDILKLEYFDKLVLMYNYGNLYIISQIKYFLESTLNELIKIKSKIEDIEE